MICVGKPVDGGTRGLRSDSGSVVCLQCEPGPTMCSSFTVLDTGKVSSCPLRSSCQDEFRHARDLLAIHL